MEAKKVVRELLFVWVFFLVFVLSGLLSAATTRLNYNFEYNLDDDIGDNNGTAYNTPMYSPGMRQTAAISLDASQSQYVTIPYSSVLCPNDITISAWVKLAKGSDNTSRILFASREVSSVDHNDANGLAIYIGGDNKVVFKTYSLSGFGICKFRDEAVVEDRWVFIAASFEQTGAYGNDLIGTACLYINGQLKVTEPNLYFKPNNSQSLSIGTAWSGDSYYNYFDGLVDDLRLHEGVMNSAEIMSLYEESNNYVACWDFENGPYDRMGIHDGNECNSPDYIWDSAVGKTSLLLNASQNQYITVPSDSNLSPNDFTVIAWAKAANDSNGTARIIFTNRKVSSANGYLLYAGGDDKWAFKTYGDSGSTLCKSDNENVVEDEWVFIAASFEQTGTSGSDLIGTARLYIDGILTKTVSGAYFKPNSSQSLSIGAAWSGTSYYNYFDGLIDDVHIYDYVLDESDLALIYSNGFDKTLRVVAYNIHYGVGTDSQLDLSRVAAVIGRSGADIIGLNAVDCNYSTRSNYVDQTAWLAAELGMYSYFGPAISTTHGNAILSKYPIIYSNNYELPIGDGQESRACIVSKIRVKDKLYSIMVTELSTETEATRIKQTDYILSLAEALDGEKIILADINCESTAEPANHIKQSYHDSFDIDKTSLNNTSGREAYILVSRDIYSSVNYSELLSNDLAELASDHQPVQASLTIYP